MEYQSATKNDLNLVFRIVQESIKAVYPHYYLKAVVDFFCELHSMENIDKVHTTTMGKDRIKKNLKIEEADVIKYCKKLILDEKCNVFKQGKNFYCEINSTKITINSYSFTIITAHRIK